MVPESSESTCSRLSRMPVVQNIRRVSAEHRFSSLIWYPTSPPTLAPRSAATRSATPMAEMRRGCVHTMDASTPAASAASSTNCGTCVVLPQPVSPEITTTCVDVCV